MLALRLPLTVALVASAVCAADSEVAKSALHLDLVAAKAAAHGVPTDLARAVIDRMRALLKKYNLRQ